MNALWYQCLDIVNFVLVEGQLGVDMKETWNLSCNYFCLNIFQLFSVLVKFFVINLDITIGLSEIGD